MRIRDVALTAVAVRISQAILCSTFFQPDEYFQSLEVAHEFVFGYGRRTWEWSVEAPIRTAIFPLLWVPIYSSLKFLRLDNTSLLILAPKVLTGLLASITDIALCRLSERILGPTSVPLTLVLSLASFFHGLALVRSLSNSLETSLTTLALSYWPLFDQSVLTFENLFYPLLIAALATAIRPTNGIIWVYMLFELALRHNFKAQAIVGLSVVTALVGITAILAVILVDTWYFETSVITPLNFLRVNLSHVSLFYGTNVWHYYLSQALPILLTTSLPAFFHGAFVTMSKLHSKIAAGARRPLHILLGLVAWTVGLYSLSGHKEWRFIHPMLPVMHIFCLVSLMSFPSKAPRSRLGILLSPVGFLILLSLPANIYTTFIHGRAQIAVLYYLRSLPAEQLGSVGFLTPCHSTPWMAYLHRPNLANGQAWSLGCEPPLGVSDRLQYLDQTNVFFSSPVQYLATRFPSNVDPHFPPSPHPTSAAGVTVTDLKRVHHSGSDVFMDDWKHEWPEYLVMFGVLPKAHDDASRSVRELLLERGYSRVWRTWNGFEEDEKRKGGMEVWKWHPKVS